MTKGQGGSRIKLSNDDSADGVQRDDDKYWKLGIFYYNKEDPALFVEKRFGVGYTNNFARPASWFMMAGLLVIIISAIIISIALTA